MRPEDEKPEEFMMRRRRRAVARISSDGGVASDSAMHRCEAYRRWTKSQKVDEVRCALAAIRLLKARGLDTPRINRARTSYGWKHIIERDFHTYVGNDAFIEAAKRAYLRTEPASGPNVYVNLSNAAADLLRGPCGGITDDPDVLEALRWFYVEVGQ